MADPELVLLGVASVVAWPARVVLVVVAEEDDAETVVLEVIDSELELELELESEPEFDDCTV